jgi:hypothetical protein
MKIKSTVSIVTLLTLSLVVACAYSASTPYVGAELGAIQLTDSFVDVFSPLTGMDERVFAGNLWGDGAWQYGVEGSFMYFHDISVDMPFFDEHINMDGYALSALGVVKYNFASGFSISAKAGPAYLSERISNSGVVAGQELTYDQVSPEVALGVSYRFNPQLEAQLTCDAIFARESDSEPLLQTRNLNLGLAYHFA